MPVFTLPKSSHPDFALPNVKPKGGVIDREHWAGRDCVFSYIRGKKNIASNGRLQQNNTVDETPRGLVIDTAGDCVFDAAARHGTDGVTILFRAEAQSTPAAWSEHITSKSFFEEGKGFWIQKWSSESSGLLVTGSGATAWHATLNQSTIAVGTEYTYVIVMDGTTAYLYEKGYTVQSGTISACNTETTDGIHIANDSGFDSPVLNSVVKTSAVFSRPFSEGEARSLLTDNYQYIKPAIPLTYFVPAAAAGGNEPLFYHHQRMLSRCS